MSGAAENQIDAVELKKLTQISPWVMPLVFLGCLAACAVGWCVEDSVFFVRYAWQANESWVSYWLGCSGFVVGTLAVLVFASPLSTASWKNRLASILLAFGLVALAYKLGLGAMRIGGDWWPGGESESVQALVVYFVTVGVTSAVLNSVLFPMRLYRGSSKKINVHQWLDQKYKRSKVQWIIGCVVILVPWIALQFSGNQDYSAISLPIVFGAATSVVLHGLFSLSAFMPNRWVGFLVILLVPAGLLALTVANIGLVKPLLPHDWPWPKTVLIHFAFWFQLSLLIAGFVLGCNGRLPRHLQPVKVDPSKESQDTNLIKEGKRGLRKTAFYVWTFALCGVLACGHYIPYWVDVPVLYSGNKGSSVLARLTAMIRRSDGGIIDSDGRPRVRVGWEGELEQILVDGSIQEELAKSDLLQKSAVKFPSASFVFIEPFSDIVSIETVVNSGVYVQDFVINGKEIDPDDFSIFLGKRSVTVCNVLVDQRWAKWSLGKYVHFRNCTFAKDAFLESKPRSINIENSVVDDALFHSISQVSPQAKFSFDRYDQIQLSEPTLREGMIDDRFQVVTQSGKRDWQPAMKYWLETRDYSSSMRQFCLATELSRWFSYGSNLPLPKSVDEKHFATDSHGRLVRLSIETSDNLRHFDLLSSDLSKLEELRFGDVDFGTVDQISDRLEEDEKLTLKNFESISSFFSPFEIGTLASLAEFEFLETLAVTCSLNDLEEKAIELPNLRRLGIVQYEPLSKTEVEILRKLPKLEELRIAFLIEDYAEGSSLQVEDWKSALREMGDLEVTIVSKLRWLSFDFTKQQVLDQDEKSFDLTSASRASSSNGE